MSWSEQIESIKAEKSSIAPLFVRSIHLPLNFSGVSDINIQIGQKGGAHYSLCYSANWDIPLDALTTPRIGQGTVTDDDRSFGQLYRFAAIRGTAMLQCASWTTVNLSSSFKCFPGPREWTFPRYFWTETDSWHHVIEPSFPTEVYII
jgi:hypothetical protein